VEIKFNETSAVKKYFLAVVRANETETMFVNDPVNRSVHISSHFEVQQSGVSDQRFLKE